MPETEIFRQDSASKRYDLNLEGLRTLLLREELTGTPVILISVLGDTRTAKGVLMNGISAFLRRKDENNAERLSNADMYRHEKDEAQHGPGCRIWDNPIYKVIEGQKVAIILMVAQVSIIDEERPNVTKRILALVSCLSSVTILNVKADLKYEDLKCAKDILTFSSTIHPVQKFMITVQKGDFQHGGNDYFKEKIENNCRDIQTKTFLSNQNVSCHVFADSGCVRDPEKRPDLKPEFMAQINNFVKETLSHQILSELSRGQALTGKKLFRYAEELNHCLQTDKMTNDIEVSQIETIVEQTKWMLDREAAFEKIMQTIPLVDFFDEASLTKHKSLAMKVYHEKSQQLPQEAFKRMEAHNQELYDKYEQAAKTIEEAVRPLHLQSSSASHGARTCHPEHEHSNTPSECGDRENIDQTDEGTSATIKEPIITTARKRKRNNSDSDGNAP